MKKALLNLLIMILSLVISLTLFETLSWYHFGDIPTVTVLFRFIFFYLMLLELLLMLTVFRNEKKKNTWKIFIGIGCIPFIAVIFLGIYSAINGFSSNEYYGFKAFIDSIIFISKTFFPVYILGIIIIVLSIVKLKRINK